MKRFFIVVLLAACGGGDDSSVVDASDEIADAQSGSDAAADQTLPKDAQTVDGADAQTGAGVPPFGGSSGGSGGATNVSGATETAGSITYRLIVPASVSKPSPFLLVYSGTEGGATMTSNLIGVGPSTGTDGF